MSELILQKKAKELCRSEGKAWSLNDFENGVPGVTMLTVVADEKKRREYLNQAKVMLKRNSEVMAAVSRPRPLCRLTVPVQ
jgi:hypothetical protein